LITNYLEETTSGIKLKIVVKPGSKQQRINVNSEGNYLLIAVKSPPDKGKANKELLKFLAKHLDLSSSNLTIISGQTSRDKTILVSNISVEEIKKRINKIDQS
jgi:uncharacterized protein (TIGR00251 family)